MTAKLTGVEILRLLRRARFWLLVVLFGAGAAVPVVAAGLNPRGYAVLVDSGRQLFPHEYATGLLVTHLGLLGLLPLLLPFVICDTLPSDRKSRYVVLLEARGATRGRLVVSRVLAGCVLGAVAVAVAFAFMAPAALLAADAVHGDVGKVGLFLPDLLGSSPALFFLVTLVTLVLACAGVLCLGVLMGALCPSWPVAVLTPPLAVLVGVFLPLPESWQPYNPGIRATFLNYDASWITPQYTALYWLVAGGLLTLAAVLVYRGSQHP